MFEVLVKTFYIKCEKVKVEFSDFVTTCDVLTVNVQMVVGGCCLTLFAPTLCTPAMTSSLAEQHFNWSQFCQTRQAKTHLGIQGVPADTHPPAHTHIILVNFQEILLISQQRWFPSPRLVRLLSQLGSKA